VSFALSRVVWLQLPFTVTEDEVRHVLSAYGTLMSVTLQTSSSGRSRGTASARFSNAHEASNALSTSPLRFLCIALHCICF
jgi:RNA recognition motif-containing protein